MVSRCASTLGFDPNVKNNMRFFFSSARSTRSLGGGGGREEESVRRRKKTVCTYVVVFFFLKGGERVCDVYTSRDKILTKQIDTKRDKCAR